MFRNNSCQRTDKLWFLPLIFMWSVTTCIRAIRGSCWKCFLAVLIQRLGEGDPGACIFHQVSWDDVLVSECDCHNFFFILSVISRDTSATHSHGWTLKEDKIPPLFPECLPHTSWGWVKPALPPSWFSTSEVILEAQWCIGMETRQTPTHNTSKIFWVSLPARFDRIY